MGRGGDLLETVEERLAQGVARRQQGQGRQQGGGDPGQPDPQPGAGVELVQTATSMPS